MSEVPLYTRPFEIDVVRNRFWRLMSSMPRHQQRALPLSAALLLFFFITLKPRVE